MTKKLKKVSGSENCLYSIIENKLETLYENQEIIFEVLKEILEELKKK